MGEYWLRQKGKAHTVPETEKREKAIAKLQRPQGASKISQARKEDLQNGGGTSRRRSATRNGTNVLSA